MASIKSEMPPLHAAESTASALSSMGSGGVSSASGGGANGSTGNATNANTSSTSSSASITNTAAVNNTISAAADSSDNQPGTPQPQTQQIGVNDHQQQQKQQQQQQSATTSTSSIHNPYAPQNMYGTTSTTAASATLPHMYSGSIYATSSENGSTTGHDIQQQQQHQQSSYPSYLSSYEQFYQQQGQAQAAHSNSNGNGSSSLDYTSAASLYSSNLSNDFKSSSASAGIRYHPYLQTPTSNGGNGGNLRNDGSGAGAVSVPNQVGLPLSSNNAAVSTTTAMSPRVVSSSSPTSTSTQLHIGGGGSGGNPQSPACGQQLLCKKCGIMCTNETELQEHITNVHGASPYGSSGYSSSPYIKEELSGAPSNQPQQQQQTGANPNELLDLDSQKMVYPPIPGSMQSIMGHSGLHHQQHHPMHDPIVSDPLHSMHTMQQRALPGWDQTTTMGGPAGNGSQEGLPPYMQQADITQKPNQSPYYSPKQSPYHGASVPGVTNIKHEYPLIKSEYADSQNYVDKPFDPTVAAAVDMCQQTQNANAQQPMLPVSSSPAEFPSTTTGPAQEQQPPYRNFEPPTSSSVLPANSITAKAASWKSNEARRPKTYNCTACNKWFTSSGHLKRHYNTTLHKNAVKTSGQPDPATMPISAHHHPARDPNGKSSRRGNNAAAAAAAAQQQKPPAPVQPPEPPRTPPDFGSSSQQQTSATNGGMTFGQPNGFQQQPQPYLSQVQSTTNVSPQHGSSAVVATQSQNQTETVLNGHPNGLAGPSALITTTAAQPTLQMPSSHTRGLLNTTTTITKREISAEEDINTTTAMDTVTATMLRSPMDMSAMGAKEMATEMLPTTVLDEAAETQVAAAAAAHLQLRTHHHQLLVKQEFQELEVQDYQLLDLQQQQLQRHYHNSTPSSSQMQSPLIISHQQYQEQLHLQQQQMVADIFSQQPQQQAHMLPLPPHSTMEAYSILGISTPPHSSSMQLLPPSQRITSTTPTIVNMDNIHMLPPQHSLLRHHQLEEQELPHHNMLNNTTLTNMQDIQRNTIITPHMPLPSIIPSYQQVPQPEQQLPLEHTMSYHTIIGSNSNYSNSTNNNQITNLSSSTGTSGNSSCDESGNNSDSLQLGSYDPYGTPSMFTTTTDGQLLQFISNNGLMQPTFISTFPTRTAAVAESYVRSYSTSSTQRSPQEADLPPISSLAHAYNQTPQESQTTLMAPPDLPYSPTVSSSTAADGNGLIDEYNSAVAAMEKSSIPNNETTKNSATSTAATKTNARKSKRAASTTTNNQNSAKRKRISSVESVSTNATTVSTTTANIILPSGRIKCLECDKEFTKICYLTQHNKCFHSGEYPFRCEKCGKRFQDEIVYTTHLGRHKTVDKPHKCELCPKQFHHKTDLRRHIEGIHTGMKQHVCDICKKSFCRKDHLRKHLETHNRPRVVPRKAVSKITTAIAKNSAKDTLLAAAKHIKENIIVKNEAYVAETSPSMSQQQHHENDIGGISGSCSGSGSGESSPLDGDCAALDLFVVIKNENEQNLDMPNIGKKIINNKYNLNHDHHDDDDDDIDVAEDDLGLDHDNDDDEDEYLLGGCNADEEVISHKLMMQRSLPHFQQAKLLQHL